MVRRRTIKLPTKAEIAASRDRTIPDILTRGLAVVFCGINPSLYSAAVGHHFARPGNRFWPTLERSQFTPRLLSPSEDRELLRYGCGLTNLVGRATARADELSRAELLEGATLLAAKARRLRPSCVTFLGITAYRQAFARPKAEIGRQAEIIEGVPVWVLPNPSGLNAHYQIDDLARLFRRLKKDIPGSRVGPRRR